jgi:hypothetical protein
MITTTFKTAALALVVLAGTAGSAFAATAWSDGDSKVKAQPKSSSATIDWLYDGEKVYVDWCGKYYCYVEHKGPDGYVRKSDLIFKKGKGKKSSGVEVCIGGGGWGGGGFGYGSLCIKD